MPDFSRADADFARARNPGGRLPGDEIVHPVRRAIGALTEEGAPEAVGQTIRTCVRANGHPAAFLVGREGEYPWLVDTGQAGGRPIALGEDDVEIAEGVAGGPAEFGVLYRAPWGRYAADEADRVAHRHGKDTWLVTRLKRAP